MHLSWCHSNSEHNLIVVVEGSVSMVKNTKNSQDYVGNYAIYTQDYVAMHAFQHRTDIYTDVIYGDVSTHRLLTTTSEG